MDDIRNQLLLKLEPYKRIGWVPITIDGDGDITTSKFSGTSLLKRGESYPLCSNCNKPLQMFVQLNIQELPHVFNVNAPMDMGIIQMFYCTNDETECDMQCQAFSPFAESTLLRIVSPNEYDIASRNVNISNISNQFPPKIIVDWEEVVDYPNIEELEQLGIELNEREEQLYWEMEIPQSGDKLGGWPYWVQGVEYPECPICNQRMRYIFQVDSEMNVPFSFGDSGCGHITQCNEHKEILAFGWACS